MYETFYGLQDRPFDLTPSPRFLVLTDSHREALRNLQYGIASRKGITLLIGEAGAGKTTVIRAAVEAQSQKVHCAHVNNPTLSRSEFVELLAHKFELSPRAAESKTILLRELESLLVARHSAGETTVLIVDEAQSLPLDLLEEIRLLANIETDSDKLLSVIMAGQPELADRLNASNLRQLKQRVALRCELRSLTRQESETYVAGRIRAAGGVGANVFTREAVGLMHEAARGLPRTINVIADNALLGGFAAGIKPVPRSIVAEVCRDFDFVVSEQPHSGPSFEPARELEPSAEAPAFEPTVPTSSVSVRPAGGDGGKTGAAGGPSESRDVFASFSARRKRFSFFWN
jgi:general secretion pathway protein A